MRKHEVKYDIGSTCGELTLIYREVIHDRDSNTADGLFLCTCGQFEYIKIKNVFYHKGKKARKKCSRCYNRSSDIYETEYKKEKWNNINHRKIEFFLTPDEYKTLITSPCHYCGCDPWQPFRRKTNKNKHILRTGIDRIDSDLPYTVDNTVSCCMDCNFAKGTKSYGEFIDWVYKVFDHMNKKAS